MIEDIDHLKENCEQDATIVYIDSTTRDRSFFPQPEEYTIQFEQPFKNVVGFDILDASVPTTMWNIDKYNSTIALTLCWVPTTALDKVNAMAYFAELRDVTLFSRMFERNHVGNEFNENSVVVISSSQYIAREVLASEVATQYFCYVRYVIENSNVKKAPKNLDASNTFTFSYRNSNYYIENDYEDVIDIIKRNNFDLFSNADGFYDLVYFDEINITSSTMESITTENTFLLRIENYLKTLTLGNYDITSLKQELNGVFLDYDVQFETTALPDRKQGIYKIQSSKYIIINAGLGQLVRQLGFDTYPTKDESSKYDTYNIHGNTKVFASMYVPSINTFTIQAPGIVNLLGNRYIILRCKEFEDHLLGSHAYTKYSPGIGLFKLAAANNDITHLRFDFVNLVRKPFHPIGKVSKLTIRFETQEGNTYDFKGVNHQLLFVMKYLVPSQKVKFAKSLLNPNYDPDFIKYMSNSRTIEYKEDSDNEEEFADPRYDQQYKKDLQQYDYSSSGDENETDDSEVEFDFSRRLA
jgi:hypothetical protein